MSTTGSTKDRTPTPDPDTEAPTTSPPTSGRFTLNHKGLADFAAQLDAARAERGVSWAEVSRRSGISENGLRRIRQGEVTPRPATIDALAKALGDDGEGLTLVELKDYSQPIPARRSAGEATTWLTVGVSSPRAQRLDRDTAGRLILFLEASARAWLATTDCTESD